MINDELERWRAVFTAWGFPPSSLKKAMKYVEDDVEGLDPELVRSMPGRFSGE